jgi:hypothetical protein
LIPLLQFVVYGLELLVRALQFFLGRFQFLVGALELLVRGLNFFVGRDEFLIPGVSLLYKRLQVEAGRIQIISQVDDDPFLLIPLISATAGVLPIDVATPRSSVGWNRIRKQRVRMPAVAIGSTST